MRVDIPMAFSLPPPPISTHTKHHQRENPEPFLLPAQQSHRRFRSGSLYSTVDQNAPRSVRIGLFQRCCTAGACTPCNSTLPVCCISFSGSFPSVSQGFKQAKYVTSESFDLSTVPMFRKSRIGCVCTGSVFSTPKSQFITLLAACAVLFVFVLFEIPLVKLNAIKLRPC